MSQQHPSAPSAGRQRDAPRMVPGRGPSRPPSAQITKRDQVLAACYNCRKRKTKCDALRPCSPCVSRRHVCEFATRSGESVSQALKRKHKDASEKLEIYQQLFNMIQTGSERNAADIVRWIRSGRNVDAIVQFANTSGAEVDLYKRALRSFLVNLAHSTGSLEQVIKLAMSISGSTPIISLPDPREFNNFRNRTVPIMYMEKILDAAIASGRLQPLTADVSADLEDNDTWPSTALQRATLEQDRDMPPHSVPALPWTSLTSDDEAVSHLVSLFLNWINPTWRFVEVDLFLQGMRSKDVRSELCSPFLVNSILAIASLHSENDVAFSDLHCDRITRGQNFHDEAKRLWSLENYHPSLTNVQALCTLSLESNYRAVDSLGLRLARAAAQLDNQLPVYGDTRHYEAQGISEQDRLRLRINTHWMVKCRYVIMRLAYMNGETLGLSQREFPKIYDVFEDEIEIWSGYPLTNSAIPYRPTLYLRERCRLAELFEEIHALILAKGQPDGLSLKGFTSSVDEMIVKMEQWHQRLPFGLQYRWPMSIAIWELHASYYSVSMIFRNAARIRLSQQEASPTGQPPLTETSNGDSLLKAQVIQELSQKLIELAHTSAQILREFRELYGLKITPAWLLLLQAVAAGILILDPDMADPIKVESHQTKERSDRITDSSAAFEEVFRCLLGAGVEVMISRAIARTTFHSALENKVIMRTDTRKLLQIMADTAWRPTDAKLVDSAFPNYATTKGHGDDAEGLTELLRRLESL